MGLRILSNKELLNLVGSKLEMEIANWREGIMVIEGCLVPEEGEIETYTFFCHGTETNSTCSWERINAHYPIYSKERNIFVNIYIKRDPRITLQSGSPILSINGRLRFNFIGMFSTSYYSLDSKLHNKGAEALNKVGIRTTTSILE